MRRSICYCEPGIALAGEEGTWNFVYTPATSLSKGAKLKFDTLSQGRMIDWAIPSASSKSETGTIRATLPDGTVLTPKEVFVSDSTLPQFEFTLTKEVPAGEEVRITMGPGEGKNAAGSTAQLHVQRRRPFYLYIDPKGKGAYEDPEVFSMDIHGNELEEVKILAPTFVNKNQRFDVVLRFEDSYGNLTNNAPEGTMMSLTYENLRENLNWKLFVPETGFLLLPNLHFSEPGVFRILLTDLTTKRSWSSSALKCFGEAQPSLFWGQLHGESERVDSDQNIEGALRHFRDEQGFGFFATSPFDDPDETSNDTWKIIGNAVQLHNEADRFAVFLGQQWVGEPEVEGVRQLIFARDAKTMMRAKEAKASTLKKLYKGTVSKEMISIPSFTMAEGYGFNFDEFDSEFERVVEIYNSWGCSEMTAKEGNGAAIERAGKKGIKEWAEGSIRKALNSNKRFGFVAGGLDDRGPYSELYENEQTQYPPGLTAILASEHTRESLFEALYNRSCYATTGDKIALDFKLAGLPMGSEIGTKAKPGLMVNRHLSGFAAANAVIRTVEIIRNGEVLQTFKPKSNTFEFEYDDLAKLSGLTLSGGPDGDSDRPPFAYYYLRVVLENEHIAWSSPIWVDDQHSEASSPAPKKRAVKK